MSFDTEKLHRLRDKGFERLYSDHSRKWNAMVDKAVEYAKTYLSGGKATDTILIGDVVGIIQNAIKVDPQFEAYVKNKKLNQKFWVTWFSEYLLEQKFPQQKIQ